MKILLIDDEVEFAAQAQTFLTAQNFSVVVESNAVRALHLVDQLSPDIVIIDVDLGHKEIDGLAISAKIAASDEYQSGNRGIIMMSGHYVAPSDEVIGFEVGADNYLIKPFDLSQLSARINALGRRLSYLEPNELRLNNTMTVAFDSREVWLSGNPVSLSRLEFNVLAYLGKPPGVVRTKSELLENVWSTPHVEEGAIAKCISILRKKLSNEEPEKYIQTVYGVGYKLAIH